jgi:hypothetical protein
MRFLERLDRATAADRNAFLRDPEIQRLLRAEVTRNEYAYFLWQSHFHMAAAVAAFAVAATRLDAAHGATARYFLHHAGEEWGEEQWCLDDLKALGAAADRGSYPPPAPACAAFMAYLRHLAERDNPVALLADSYVVEGLATALAGALTDNLRQRLRLPAAALTYLERHARLEGGHFDQFACVLENAVRDEKDFDALVQGAKVLFWTFAEFLRDVARVGDQAGARILQAGAAAATNFDLSNEDQPCCAH